MLLLVRRSCLAFGIGAISHKNWMAAQTKISSFFNSPNQKVPKRSHANDQNGTGEEAKKQKLIETHQNTDSAKSLTDEEQSKMEQNRLNAKLKLLSTKTSGLVCNIGPSWLRALEKELSKDYIVELGKFISSERQKGTVYPPPDQVFSWTTACDINSIKVVILGQDPYHGPRQAHGLCFSVLPGVKPPPSLANMFKELTSSIDGFKKPSHGCLIGWANQGVLLLNACLTVKAGQANSHAGKGWENLTDAVIQWLNANLNGVVFLLWGAYAQKKGACIDKKRHHILKAVHPSPLSAHRGFFGCKHFSHCNELLKEGGKEPIDWSYLPEKI